MHKITRPHLAQTKCDWCDQPATWVSIDHEWNDRACGDHYSKYLARHVDDSFDTLGRVAREELKGRWTPHPSLPSGYYAASLFGSRYAQHALQTDQQSDPQ